MRNKPIKHATILVLAGLRGVLFLQTSTRADTVLPGYDLFTTDPATSFAGVNWAGVPLGTYSNFAGFVGQNVYVGATDTIMQRLGTWNSTTPGNPAISLQLDALQLVSTTPMFGPGVYGYITLDPTHTSSGTITIDFNGPGTFSTTFDVYFDLRIGSLNGNIYGGTYQEITGMTGTGYWQHPPTSPELLIPGVNYWLDGMDFNKDFQLAGGADGIGIWPELCSAGGDYHWVVPTIPEPSGLALLGVGVLCLAIKTRRGRK